MITKLMQLTVAGLTLALASMAAQATPILLGEITGDSIGSQTGSITALNPAGVVFVLGYSPPDTFACAGYVGCEKVWALGETGSFDFNSSNATEFSSMAARLTDGADQNLSRGAWTINAAATSIFPGSIAGGPDSPFDLGPGVTIDFVRLAVTATRLDITIVNNSQTSNQEYRGTWQLWGTVAVPEPSTLALFGIGLAGLGCGGRKKI